MAEGSDELEQSSREQLILKARVLGVERAELMTRVELRDEIVRRSTSDPAQQKRARGFLGVARDLVASVVEAGLNLPDAAKLIRGEGARESDWKGPPPVATVTLAEIYATQGHLDRALRMLDEVLAKEPDHDPARALRTRLASGGPAVTVAPRKRIKINFADPPDSEDAPAPDSNRAPVSEPAPVSAESAPAPVPAVEPEPVFVAPEPAPAPVPFAEPAPVISADPGPVPAVEPAPAPVPADEAAPALLTFSLANRRQIYWELPATTWDPLRARSPQGRAILRVISFRTRGGKVERRSLDIAPHAAIGSSELPGFSSSAVIRAALGWEADGRFTPFVVATDVGSESGSAGRAGQFRPHHLVGAVSADAERRALEHLTRRG